MGYLIGYGVAVTFEKLPVQSTVLLWLVTACPMVALVAIVMVVALPNPIHLLPLDEYAALKEFPVRVIFTQYGAINPDAFTEEVAPAVLVRHWKLMPLPGVTKTAA